MLPGVPGATVVPWIGVAHGIGPPMMQAVAGPHCPAVTNDRMTASGR